MRIRSVEARCPEVAYQRGGRSSIVELLDEISEATDMDDGLRVFLVGHLHEMLRTVDEFSLVGTEALEAALQRALGHPYVIAVARRALPDTPQVKKFSKLLNTVALVLAIVAEGLSITQSIAPQLLPAQSIVIEVDATPETVTGAPKLPEGINKPATFGL